MYYVYIDRPCGEVSSCYNKRQESWRKLGTEYSFSKLYDAKSFIRDELYRYCEIKDCEKRINWVNKNVNFRMEWVDEDNPNYKKRQQEAIKAKIEAEEKHFKTWLKGLNLGQANA